MEKRTTGLIATIASVLLCGCPGIFLCIFGAASALGGGTMTLGDTTQPLDPTYGYVFLCLSLIFIAIPIVVGFVTLRKKPQVPVPGRIEPIDNEPLPPAS